MSDITNPAFNYDAQTQDYASHRQTDPRIAAYIHNALSDAHTILNVGAGAGSYEPEGKYIVAVEPSQNMRLQRLERNRTPAINAKADALPFDDNSFDASMATITVHHWPDVTKGLQEMRRVTKGAVAILTFDPDELDRFWNKEYMQALIDVERQRYPSIATITNALGGQCTVEELPIPLDCLDGFQEAFYGRPEAFLNKEVRKSQSAWGFLKVGEEERMVQRLGEDLASGAWDKKYSSYRTMPQLLGGLRLITAR